MDMYAGNGPDSALDLVFIMDCTGSMGSYIASATANIETICEEITRSEKLPHPESLRLAIVAYRDHPPQDVSYVTKVQPFTSDVPQMKEFLKNLYASGGGDGPEAVTAGIREALELDWRPNAAKVCILIADAPPHGIGEYGDGFSQGSPDGYDPLQLVREMASRGIALFMVACEPALSQYTHATDFFRALAQLSAGTMLPLTNADLLAKVIVGSALEHMDMERLIQEVGAAVSARVHSGQESVDDVARALHESLKFRNESTKQLVIDNIYRDSEEARHNVSVWMSAPDLASAKPHLQKVTGSRFTDKYLETRYGRTSLYRTAPPVPARPSTTSDSSPFSSSPPSSTGGVAGSPGSPSRKVASSFASFSAPKMSFESTPVNTVTPAKSIFGSFGNNGGAGTASTSGTNNGGGGSNSSSSTLANGAVGLAAGANHFGNIRDGNSSLSSSSRPSFFSRRSTASMMDDDADDDHFGATKAGSQQRQDDDDDDDDDADGITMRRATISLEQAKRITMQSAWRGLRA